MDSVIHYIPAMTFGTWQSYVFIVGIILYFVNEKYIFTTTRTDFEKEDQDENSAQKIWNAHVIAILAAVIIHFMPILDIFNFSPLAFVPGFILLIGGIVVRHLAYRTLRKHFSVVVQIVDGQELVSHGLYKFVRNPAYTGSIIEVIGVTLIISNALTLLIACQLIFGCYIRRISVEEKVLKIHFQDKFDRYCEKTPWRIFPFIY